MMIRSFGDHDPLNNKGVILFFNLVQKLHNYLYTLNP